MKILIIFTQEIHCVNNSLSQEKIKNIIKEIINENKLFQEFISFIIEKNKQNPEGIFLNLDEKENINNPLN